MQTESDLSASFMHGNDGHRVKSVVNGETILFVGGYFEQKGSEVTKNYPGGAIRKYVIPQSMNVEYALGDHLGSASVMTDSLGNKVSEMRYTPWGEVRYSRVEPGVSTTPAYKLPTKTFTGQFSYMDDLSTEGVTEGFGLMFYNSRFYDPQIGRFSQADTVVPGGVLGLDRYAYVNNSPVNYTDPSGHYQERSDYQMQIHAKKMGEVYEPPKSDRSHGHICDEYSEYGACTTWDADFTLAYFDITVTGATQAEKWVIANAALLAGFVFDTLWGSPGENTFRTLHGPITIIIENKPIGSNGNCNTVGGTITCSQAPTMATTLHEFGHVLDNNSELRASGNLYVDTGKSGWSRKPDGFICDDSRCLEHPPKMGYLVANEEGKLVLSTDQTIFEARAEQFADLYMNFMLYGAPNHGLNNTRYIEFLDIMNKIY